MKKTLLFLLLMGICLLVYAQTATWALTSSPGSCSASGNWAGTNLVLGSGIALGEYSTNGVRSTGWDQTLRANDNNGGDYYQYSLTATSNISINSIGYQSAWAGNKVMTTALYYAIGTGSFTNQIGSNLTVNEYPSYSTFSNTPTQPIGLLSGQTINFRVYAWSTSSNSKTFYNRDFVVTYAVSNATGNFRTLASGDWSDINNWQSSDDDTNWIYSTLYPTSSATKIFLQSGHSITLTGDIIGDNLTFNGGSLELDGYTLEIPSKDFAITSDDAVLTDLDVSLSNTSNTYGSGTSIARTWTTAGNMTNSADLSFTYPESETNAATVNIWRRAVGDTGVWELVGTYTTVDNGTTRTVTATGVTVLDDYNWTISTLDQTLPVELASFTGVITPQNNIMLQWMTHSETNVSGYYVFRYYVDNLSNAERINAFIPATNTSQEANYVFVDNETIPGNTYYYWLQHVEMGGESEFHGPINVHLNVINPVIPVIPFETRLQEIYPNPFAGQATISYGLAKAAKVELVIMNTKGQVVRHLQSGSKNAGNYRIWWNGANDSGVPVTTGVYFVRMVSEKSVSTQKLVIMK